MIFAQLLANGLIAGSIYALVAVGFSLIYSTNRFMHFAHGVSVTAAAYLLLLFFSTLGLPFWLAVILTIVGSAGIGLAMFRLIYHPLQKRNASNIILLIASLGILILIENLILLFFGSDVKTIRFIEVARGKDVLGAIVTPLQMWIFVISIALLITLYIVMKKTKLGRNMRAVADAPELASVIGINRVRIGDYSFIIGSALAAIAGILIGLEQSLEPTMGTTLIIKGFTGAVIGGITSVPAAVLGSYLLGLVENFGIWYLPSGFKDAIAFVLLFIFLLFKPTGIFGINKGVKK
jgi:branched-chain amino acid transport system permease protein